MLTTFWSQRRPRDHAKGGQKERLKGDTEMDPCLRFPNTGFLGTHSRGGKTNSVSSGTKTARHEKGTTS